MTIDETEIKNSISLPKKDWRLQSLEKVSAPSFWEDFADRFSYRTTNPGFVVDGVTFFFGDAQGLLDVWKPPNSDAEDRFVEIMKYFVFEDVGRHHSCKWIVTSDGTPFRKDGHKGELLFKTAQRSTKGNKKKWVTIPILNISEDPNHKPEWDKLHHFVLAVERLAIEKWKEERRAFLREAKKTGALEKRQKEKKARRMMERTNRKMKTVSQARTVIQELEQYIKDVENGTATQSQVGDVYREMSTLMSLNKRVKTLFPKN